MIVSGKSKSSFETFQFALAAFKAKTSSEVNSSDDGGAAKRLKMKTCGFSSCYGGKSKGSFETFQFALAVFKAKPSSDDDCFMGYGN